MIELKLGKNPCPDCGSRDNLHKFKKGTSFCFTPECNYNRTNKKSLTVDIIGEFKSFRGISEETSKEYMYQLGTMGNEEVHIMNYFNKEGNINAQKIRKENKEFAWINRNGVPQSMFGLYSRDWDYNRSIVVTEGEIDALSCFESGFQAVSLPDGAGSAEKSWELDKKELLKFKEIILFLDNDEEGQKATERLKQLIPIEKLRYVNIGGEMACKDANDFLNAGELKNLLNNFVIEYIPEGIVFGNQIKKDNMLIKKPAGFDLPWPKLTKMLRGLRPGKLVLFGGGSNLGKTPVMREIAFYLRTQFPDMKIGNIYLEDADYEAENSFIALAAGIPQQDFIQDPLKYITKEQYDFYYNELLNTENVVFLAESEISEYNSEKLFKTLEYLGTIKKFDIVFIDHLSWIVTNTSENIDERKAIDKMMQKLKGIAKKTGMIIFAANHLSQPTQGPDWDEGREVSQRDFRGSGSLRMVPDILLGIERNAKNPIQREKSIIRVIKNRGYGSDVGEADILYFQTKTGRLKTLDQLGFGGKKSDD